MKCDYCEYRNTCTALVSKNTSLIRCFSVDKSTVKIGDTIYVIKRSGNFRIEKAEVTELYSNAIFCNRLINPSWDSLGNWAFKTYDEAVEKCDELERTYHIGYIPYTNS